MKRWKIIDAKTYEKRMRDLTWAMSFVELYSIGFDMREDEDVEKKTECAKNFMACLESVKHFDKTAYKTLVDHVHKKQMPEIEKWLKEHPAE